jgi:hypothetical protein
MMMNATMTLQPTTPFLSTLLNFSFTSILFNNYTSSLCFRLCSLFSTSFPLLFVVVFQLHSCTHTIVNSKISKTCTTSNNKHKLFLMVTSFFLVFEHSTRHIHFFIYLSSFN